jgi:hypothetical protein
LHRSQAVRVLKEALLVDESNPKLFLQLLDVYLHRKPIVVADVVEGPIL